MRLSWEQIYFSHYSDFYWLDKRCSTRSRSRNFSVRHQVQTEPEAHSPPRTDISRLPCTWNEEAFHFVIFSLLKIQRSYEITLMSICVSPPPNLLGLYGLWHHHAVCVVRVVWKEGRRLVLLRTSYIIVQNPLWNEVIMAYISGSQPFMRPRPGKFLFIRRGPGGWETLACMTLLNDFGPFSFHSEQFIYACFGCKNFEI
jgi:hypothetical protein